MRPRRIATVPAAKPSGSDLRLAAVHEEFGAIDKARIVRGQVSSIGSSAGSCARAKAIIDGPEAMSLYPHDTIPIARIVDDAQDLRG